VTAAKAPKGVRRFQHLLLCLEGFQIYCPRNHMSGLFCVYAIELLWMEVFAFGVDQQQQQQQAIELPSSEG